MKEGDPLLNKWEGIVIRTISYGETNKIVTLFTEEAGKVTAMARGAKKPRSKLSAVTQPFTFGHFLIRQGRGMGTISQGETIQSMRFLRENLEATSYASYIVEIVDKLVEQNTRSTGIYTLLVDALNAINEEYPPEVITLFVEWKMLQVAGIHVVLDECASCGATDGEFGFSFQEMGFICHRCFHRDRYVVRLAPTHIRLIRMFATVAIHQIGNISMKKETVELLSKIVRTLYDEQTGIYFKSRKFLETLEQTPALQSVLKQPKDET